MNRQMFFVFLLVAGIFLTISEVEGNFGHFGRVRVRTPLRRKRDIHGLPGNGLGMGPRRDPDYHG